MEQGKRFGRWIAGQIAQGLALPLLLTLGPPALALALSVIGLYPIVVIAFLAGGWSITTVGGIVWIRRRLKRQLERTTELAYAMFLSDVALTWWTTEAGHVAVTERRYQLESLFKDLLDTMCSQLALSIPHSSKGATFLIFTEDRFELFAHFHHDQSQDAKQEIRQHLSRTRGLAAQAVREGRCIPLRDCRRVPDNIDWVQTTHPPRFIGRAATPVLSGQQPIGALCFDTKKPYEVSASEQLLMQAFARKIAGLWELLNEQNGTVVRRTSSTRARRR